MKRKQSFGSRNHVAPTQRSCNNFTAKSLEVAEAKSSEEEKQRDKRDGPREVVRVEIEGRFQL